MTQTFRRLRLITLASKVDFAAALVANPSVVDEASVAAEALVAAVSDAANSTVVSRDEDSDEEVFIALVFAASTILDARDSTVWRFEDVASTVSGDPVLDVGSAVVVSIASEALVVLAVSAHGVQASTRSTDSAVRDSDHSPPQVSQRKDSIPVLPPSSPRRW